MYQAPEYLRIPNTRTYFEPAKGMNMRAQPEVLQNIKCLNCGRAWKEHNGVPGPGAGAGACLSDTEYEALED